MSKRFKLELDEIELEFLKDAIWEIQYQEKKNACKLVRQCEPDKAVDSLDKANKADDLLTKLNLAKLNA